MIISFLRGAFGLADMYPVSGFITSTPEAIFFDESFRQVNRIVVDVMPVMSKSFYINSEYLGGKAFDRDPWQDEKTCIINDTM